MDDSFNVEDFKVCRKCFYAYEKVLRLEDDLRKQVAKAVDKLQPFVVVSVAGVVCVIFLSRKKNFVSSD